MSKNILATPKGKTITLSDGKNYTLSPFNLNTLANLEEAFDCDMGELQGELSGRMATVFRKLLYVLLMQDYPDLTEIDVGKLVEVDGVGALVKELTAVLNKLET